MIRDVFTNPTEVSDVLAVYDLEGLFPDEVAAIRNSETLEGADTILCTILERLPHCLNVPPQVSVTGLRSWIGGLRVAAYRDCQERPYGEPLETQF